MKVDLVHTAAEIEQPLQNQEKPDLSRRALLAWLPILGVGCAAAITLGVREADATPVTDAESKAKKLDDDKPLAEGKKAEPVGPDDELEISSQTRGMVRRGARRTVRRTRRTARRTARRTRRAVRRAVP
jgi:hypothetical protein